MDKYNAEAQNQVNNISKDLLIIFADKMQKYMQKPNL
jgi:hypothetical protein